MPIDYSKRSSSGAADSAPASSGPISLTKRGQQVSLTKGGSGGPVRVNLNWNQAAGTGGKGGFFKRASSGIDLDLGCLFELADGTKGVVQALGNAFGSLTQPPYVKLDKDDRSGQASDGENLYISEAHSEQLARIAVFAFIYEGVAKWSEAQAHVTIHPPQGAPITIELNETRDGVGMCGVCLVQGGAGGFTVQREVQYVGGHRDLDQLYGWNLKWTRGQK